MNFYDRYVEFYEENKEKCMMPKRNNYPIDYKKANTWVESQLTEDYKAFAKLIIEYTIHVPFSEFYSNIQKVCESFNDSHKDVNGVFVLIVPPYLYKSNLWVSLLAFKFIEKITHAYNYVTDVFNATLDEKSDLYNKNVHCIICDDCAYTGSQIFNMSSIDYKAVNFPDKKQEPDRLSKTWLEWYDETSVNAKKFISGIDIKKFSVSLVIPWLTKYAIQLLQDLHYVKIPKDKTRVWSFPEFININRFPIPLINEFKNTFQYHNNITSIYFDHKIADAVSTFNKVYFLGPIFNTYSTSPFIHGCDNSTPDDIDTHEQYLAVEKSTSNTLCPQTFYKSLKYTFRGVHINDFYAILE
jgi:hypothetical protein